MGGCTIITETMPSFYELLRDHSMNSPAHSSLRMRHHWRVLQTSRVPKVRDENNALKPRKDAPILCFTSSCGQCQWWPLKAQQLLDRLKTTRSVRPSHPSNRVGHGSILKGSHATDAIDYAPILTDTPTHLESLHSIQYGDPYL
jgi:hypothetical protein